MPEEVLGSKWTMNTFDRNPQVHELLLLCLAVSGVLGLIWL